MSDTQDAVAEKERFELSNPFTGYTISSRAPSTKLGDFSIFSCERFQAAECLVRLPAKTKGLCQHGKLYHSLHGMSMKNFPADISG